MISSSELIMNDIIRRNEMSIITEQEMNREDLISIERAKELADNRFEMAMQLAEKGYRQTNDYEMLDILEKSKVNGRTYFINGYINALLENDLLDLSKSNGDV